MRFIFIFISTSLSISAIAQDLSYAKEVVKKLASPQMKGRGYVENGDKAAAEFIASEFQACGLKKYGKNYFQDFSTPVNSFPGKMELSINGKALVPGQDFLVDAGSPSIKGSFQAVQLTADDLLQDNVWTSKLKSAAGKFVVVQPYAKEKYDKDQLKRLSEISGYLQYSSDNPARGSVILTSDKLTWSGSTTTNSTPSFVVKTTTLSLPVEKIEVNIENKFIRNYNTQNVIGYIEGSNTDSLLVFTAHYDHLGMMGSSTMFPGANDNASGVAFLLNLVKHYTKNKPRYTTVFIAFAAEEIGLIGSQYFTKHPLFPLSKIKFLVNFDLAGTGDDGIQVVNGKVYPAKFDLLSKINSTENLMKQVKIRGEACNSDHCMFHNKGVKCFYIYTLGGIQAYHDIYDKAETLPLTEFEDYFRLFTKFVDQL
jgi:aminopeptidase YwaD